MSKQKAVRIEHLADMPLDLPGAFLRIERRHWADGTSCLHVAKWGTQPTTGKPAPWWPLQYTQIPWELAGEFVEALGLATADACRECGCTDMEGCPEGCWWVEEDLCSSCATPEQIEQARAQWEAGA